MPALLPDQLSIGVPGAGHPCLGVASEPWADVYIDLSKPFSLGKHFKSDKFGSIDLNEGEYKQIHVHNMLENVADVAGTLTTLGKMLKPWGTLSLRVPHPLAPSTWNEGTYKNLFGVGAFDILDQRPDLLGLEQALVLDRLDVVFTDLGYQLHVNHQVPLDQLLHEPRALAALDYHLVQRAPEQFTPAFSRPKPEVTIAFATYKRPSLAMRQIDALIGQGFTNIELLLIGDKCPDFARMMEDKWFQAKLEWARGKGMMVRALNMQANHGTPHEIINYAIKEAEGKYLMFAADDDYVRPTHVESYLSGIRGSDFDLIIHDSQMVGDYFSINREARLEINNLGHSEIIVKVDAARKAPKHVAGSAHDWDFIAAIAANGEVGKSGNAPTYCVNMTSRTKHFQVA